MSGGVEPALAVLGRGVVDVTAPALRADDLGVQRGDGVFETARVHDGRVFKLGLHLERLRRSASALGLACPADDEWRALTADVVAASGDGDGLVKLVCTRGPVAGGPVTAFALAMPMPAEAVRARAEGIDVVTLTLGVSAAARAESPWLLGGAKTLSYAVNMATLREAESRGVDDAIWLATGGEVLEGPTATVCWVAGDRLRTPPTTTGILAGTTLAVIAALADPLAFEVAAGTAADLAAADEVFLASSVRGVAGVRRIDGVPVGDGGVGPHTRRLRDAFEDAVAGRRAVAGVD
ncbi:MAG: 4-amino-4-deoxychorismate lyase [Frankiaceae bacterium]|nr:4-amino-4-deoxychorismate lyase [Frankiaceae bacterium]